MLEALAVKDSCHTRQEGADDIVGDGGIRWGRRELPDRVQSHTAWKRDAVRAAEAECCRGWSPARTLQVSGNGITQPAAQHGLEQPAEYGTNGAPLRKNKNLVTNWKEAKGKEGGCNYKASLHYVSLHNLKCCEYNAQNTAGSGSRTARMCYCSFTTVSYTP